MRSQQSAAGAGTAAGAGRMEEWRNQVKSSQSPASTPEALRNTLRTAHREAETARSREKNALRSTTAAVDMKAIREDRSDTSSLSSHRERKNKGDGFMDMRDMLRTALRPSSMLATQLPPPQRRDLGARMSTDKIITETLRNSLGGMRALFQGPGDKALETWGKIAASGKRMSKHTIMDIQKLQVDMPMSALGLLPPAPTHTSLSSVSAGDTIPGDDEINGIYSY